MADDQQSTIASLKRLVERYRAEGTSLANFEDEFLALHSRLPDDMPDGVAAMMDELFWAVESYVSDPTLRDSGDTGDEELRTAVRRVCDALGSA